MPAKPRSTVAAPPPSRSSRRLAPAVIGLTVAVLIVYANSLNVPFVFDDRAAILENPSIRQLGELSQVLSPPTGGGSVSGRPLVNLSLAINYAMGGTDPRGYHVFNLFVHLLAGLTLFGIVRRTWLSVERREDSATPGRAQVATPTGAPAAQVGLSSVRFGDSNAALFAAFAVALLWLVHPLQTAAVTYVVQRAEALMGLFYLLTVYGFVRGVGIPSGGAAGAPPTHRTAQGAAPWFAVSIVACALGMATKETMVTAPLLVLLFDRTFVAGRFASAWRQRRGYYLALAVTWLVLALLLSGAAGRGGTVGFDAGVSSWRYLLTQCEALTEYLKLALWPHPLVFDRGEYLVRSPGEVVPDALLILALLSGTVFALRRFPVPGFFAAAFFILLAPTSSVVPIASQTIAEHRMYLPLAALVAAIVAGAGRLPGARTAKALALLLLAAFAGSLTIARNRTYASELELWADTVRHVPANPRAQSNLGIAYLESGRAEPALAAFQAAARLQPDSAEIHVNLCLVLSQLGRFDEAVIHGERAVELAPEYADARINLAAVLVRLGRFDAAIEHYATAHRLEPNATDLSRMLADARVEQAKILARRGEWEEAQRQVADALRVAPAHVEAHFAAGNLAAAAQDFAGAITAYERALALDSEHVAVRNNLANALLVSGRASEAIHHYQDVLRRRPGDESVRANLQRALELSRAEPRTNTKARE